MRLFEILVWWLAGVALVVATSRSSSTNAQRLSSGASQVAGLCADSRCSCSSSTSPISAFYIGRNISCHCSPQDQEATLNIHPMSVHYEVSSLVIQGCREVVFHEGSLRQLTRLASLTVVDVGEVVFQSGSFNQANVERSTTVSISRCRELTVKSAAFASHPFNPVAFYSSQCHAVRVDESAFSRLYQLTLNDIQTLNLASHAFRFAVGGPPGAASLDGVRTDITIRDVTMTDLRSFTFPSPLDRLTFENVTITGQIQSNATSALRIVQLSVVDSKIGSLATGAFSEFTHLDSLEMRSTQVDEIAAGAFASAASSLTIEDCQIGEMNRSALSMPAARVTLRANRIAVLATGALYLREWNELLIENNTVDLVERQAFYNIGEPKPPHAGQADNVRFVIRNNVFRRVQPGAFIISAQVPQLKLEDNQFDHLCDCQMGSWAAELTQVNRRVTELTTHAGPLQQQLKNEPLVPEALWLGSSLYNTSACWLDEAAVQCLQLSTPTFLPMDNYTSAFCSAQRQSEVALCVALARSVLHNQRGGHDDDGSSRPDGESPFKPIGLRSDQDVLLVIILAVLIAFILLVATLSFIFARRRSKARHHQPDGASGCKIASGDERVTCSPLIPRHDLHADNQLESGGHVLSGSISRLTVKEYRSYLEELGPIYSEPLDPPYGTAAACIASTALSPIPPAVPAMPAQWTPKAAKLTDTSDDGKRTMDRGTQTFQPEGGSVAAVDVTAATGDDAGLEVSNLAQEFAQDVMAALKDKLDVSPLYSEACDSINRKQEPDNVAASSSPAPLVGELYDLISVLDSKQQKQQQPRPSTSSAGSENIYCKPWGISTASTCPMSSANSPTAGDPKFFSTPVKAVDQPVTVSNKATRKSPTPISLQPPSQSGHTNAPKAVKEQPFHVRGSLPKWPPPNREQVKSPVGRNRPLSGSAAAATKQQLSNGASSPPPPSSPVKDTKPPWRGTAAARTTAQQNKPKSPVSNGGRRDSSPTKTIATSLVPAKQQNPPTSNDPSTNATPVGNISPSEALPQDTVDLGNFVDPKDKAPGDEYAEVTASPFSFSFRRPLFGSNKAAAADKTSSGPPKPARIGSPSLCDYADPRDLAEHLYSELVPPKPEEKRTSSQPA